MFNAMLRIARAENAGHAVFALSGRIEECDVPELQRLFSRDAKLSDITLDLEELRLVDRQVVRFLAACEEQGTKLTNCPNYVREWMGTRSVTP